MRYAVFDIGSNSLKFIVAERRGGRMRLITETSRFTRLAEDLIHTGSLKQDAIERTLSEMSTLRVEAEKLGVKHFCAVATSAVRDSKNRKKFLKAAAAVLGFPVRLISGNEEANIIFEGVSSDPHWAKSSLFIIDIGGGSAEWIQGSGRTVTQRFSLPLGCVRLRERFIHQHPVGSAGVERLRTILHQQLQPALAHCKLEDRLLVGTGGTSSCLAAMEMKLKEFDPQKINHFVLTRRQIGDRIERLKSLSLDQLARVPGLPKKRIDLIIPGAALMYVCMEILGAQNLTVSMRGLRYGVLYRLVHEVDAARAEAQASSARKKTTVTVPSLSFKIVKAA
jgi:exopolyphosphatase / guanosine-5'-triphosphate,3'-diphosphate pyrophosphatase